MSQLPFEHLNLRRNPFGNLPREVRAEVAVVETERYVDRLARDGTAVEIVGPSGRGKTTRLVALREAFEEARLVEVEPDGSAPVFPDTPVLLVDEFQFLDRRRRVRACEIADRLVVATHASMSAELRTAGFDVETVDLERIDGPDLRTFTGARIEWARRGAGQVPEIADEALAWLREEYGSDLRAIERHLYEVFQDLAEPRPVVVGDLEQVERRPTPSAERRAERTQ